MRPQDIASWYHQAGINYDAQGVWLFSQGDKVHWCAAFVLQCCRESGNWYERKLSDRGKLRSVGALVNDAKLRRLYVAPTTNDHQLMNELVRQQWAGLAAVFERGNDTYGHIALVDLDAFDRSQATFNCFEGNFSDALKYTSHRRFDAVTAWVLLPKGGPE